MTYEVVQEVKRIIINPLDSFNVLLDMDVPKGKYPYISDVYQALNPILTGVYKLDVLEQDLNRLLSEKDFGDDQLAEIYNSSLINRKVKLFNDLMMNLKDDVIKIETKYTNKLSEKSSAQKAANMVVKLINKIEIDPDKIVDELTIIGISEHHADTFAAILCKITNQMIRQIIKMADESNEGEFTMDASIKKENQEMLPEEVNKLDKEHGLDLKKPKNVVNYEQVYEFAINEYITYLRMVILDMNDIKIDKFFELKKKGAVQYKKIKIGNKVFKKYSPFFKDGADEMEYETDMVMYRGRFLVYLLQELVKYLEEMTMVYADHVGSEFSKWEDRHKVLRLFNDNIKKFVVSWSSGKDYSESLMFLYQAFAIMKSEKPNKTSKDLEVIQEQIEAFVIGQRPLTKFSLDTSTSVDTILKLAYIVLTEQTRVKDNIRMTQNLRYRDKSVIRDRIAELGESIIKYQESYDCDNIELFEVFLKASPKFKFRYVDVVDDENLDMGCRALAFLGLLTNNKYIWKLVKKIAIA